MKVARSGIKPNWSLFEKRPTWGHISTPEVSKLLNVSLQSVNNYVLRGTLPPPEPKALFKGNKNRWCIARLRSWFEAKPEEQIHMEWIKQNLPEFIKTIPWAKYIVHHCYDILEVEKP